MKEKIALYVSKRRKLFHNRVFDILNLKSFYFKFFQTRKHLESTITPTQVYDVVVNFNQEIINKVATSIEGVHLPYFLGKLTTTALTKEYSTKTFKHFSTARFPNHNTNGKLLKIVYDYKEARVKNLDIWKVSNASQMRKFVSKNAEKNYTRYLEYESDKLIAYKKSL